MADNQSIPDSQDLPISAKDLKEVLLKRYAIFTGGHDKEFRSLIIFQDRGMDGLSDDSYITLMQYFSILSTMLTCVQEFTVIIDRRTGNWAVVKSIVTKLNENFPGNLHQIFVIKPQSFMQNMFLEKTVNSIRDSCKIPLIFVDKAEELFPFIDQQHLTDDLGGELHFNVEDWLTNRIHIEEYFEEVENLYSELKNILNHCATDQDCHQRQDYYCNRNSKTYDLNKLYSCEHMHELRKKCHHWLHCVSDCEVKGLKIRESLLKKGSGQSCTSVQRKDTTTAGYNTSSTAAIWANASDAYDLPVDYVFHIISFDRILVRLTEARTELRRYWSEYMKRVRVTFLIGDIEKQYYEFTDLANTWNNLIESLVDYLPVKMSNPSVLSPVQHQHNHSSSDDKESSISSNNSNNSSYSASHFIILSALKSNDSGDEDDATDASLSKTILESLELLSYRILEAETTGSRLLTRLKELERIANHFVLFIINNDFEEGESLLNASNGKDNNKASFLCDVDRLVSENLISNIHPESSITVNGNKQNDVNLNMSCLSQCPEEEESLNFVTSHEIQHSPNQKVNEFMQQYFLPIKFPLNVKEWSLLFKNMIDLASVDLPRSADQINRLLQLYSEIDNAASWIKEGHHLLEKVTPPNKLSAMDLIECRSHMDELIAFTSSRQIRLELLQNPKLFHSRLVGLLDADLKGQLSKLLKQVEDLAQNCNLAIASIRQHISRTSFPRNHPNSQSFNTGGSTLASRETNSLIGEAPESSSSSEGLNSKAADSIQGSDLTSLCQLPRLESSVSLSTPGKRYQLAWKELIDTEKSFVNFLQYVYDVVWLNSIDGDSNGLDIRSYPQPVFMRDNQNRLLCNWPELLRFHKDTLLPHLILCDGNPVKLKSWVFLMIPHLVDLYTMYCSLHECAVQLAAALEKDRIYCAWITACNEEIHRREMSMVKINDQNPSSLQPVELSRPILPFSSRLVTPVQRFQRYHLLIDRLVHHETNESDRCDLQIAHKTILELCETVNITMQLRGLSVRPSELGPFLLQGDFTISRDDVRFMSSKQRHVFLFTNAILLTKYRPAPNSILPVLINPSAIVNSTVPSISRDHSADMYKKSTTFSPYNNQSTNPLGTTSNLLAFTKSFTSSGGSSNNNLASTCVPAHTSGPFYEIKQELELSKIGLTPHFHGDRRRFAVWTAKRAVTFIFQSSDPTTRDMWVKAINELLMMQLLRDRNKVLGNNVTQSGKVSSTKQSYLNADISDRSKSLPVGGKTLSHVNQTKKGSVVSLPSTNLGSNSGSSASELHQPHLDTATSLLKFTSEEVLDHDNTDTKIEDKYLKNKTEESDNTDYDKSQLPGVKQFSIGIYSVLKDTIDKFELAFFNLQSSQKHLQDQLITLDQALCRLTISQDSPLDLEPFVPLLQEYKQRILKVHNSLRISQYLRGLDLSGVNFEKHKDLLDKQRIARRTHNVQNGSSSFPLPSIWPSTEILQDMCRLQWLKLKNVGLKEKFLPKEITHLEQLESLSLARNELTSLCSIKGWPNVLPSLRMITCRKNELTNRDAIPADLFECSNLQVVDFSFNHLTQLPNGIEKAKGLLALNLSNNQIALISPDLFVQCTELMFLDLGNNKLENLPAQLRRCCSLQQLILCNNPLRHAQLRSVTALKQLEVLNLSGTERRVDNIPNELDRLERLIELDLSCNLLTKIPEPVLLLRNLRKLHLAHNELSDLSTLTGDWPRLEYLNLSYNQLTHLPTGLIRLSCLRKLYVNNNQLTFGGIPSGIGKLQDLEIFDASHNELETIPESLCRCGRLKRLILNSNRLLTLPDAIHYLKESLDVFEVDNNPQLKIPPKPPELQKGAGLAFYNIDFSLDAQLRMMRGKPALNTETVQHAKDPASRLRRLRRLRGESVGKGSKCVLEGMQRIAKEKEVLLEQKEHEAEEETRKLAARRWQDLFARPRLDYTGIFDEDTGVTPGVQIWELDQFYPRRVEDEVLQGHLFNGDCYVILKTAVSISQVLEWAIYYWIGSRSSKDKQTCAAIHAVNLRNLLGAECRTKREAEGDESSDFLALFGGNLIVLDGARGETGFIHVEDDVVVPRLYRLFGTEKRLKIVSMPLTHYSLDSKFSYLLDAQSHLYLWIGKNSRSIMQTKGRLLAEKISVRERRGEASIHIEPETRESNPFWAIVTGVWVPAPLPKPNNTSDHVLKPVDNYEENKEVNYPPAPIVQPPKAESRDFIPQDWRLPHPILYDVQMGRGYLELPQVELENDILSKKLLDSKHVYILDSGGQLFLWMGEKSSKFLRFAGYKLALQLIGLMPRSRLGGLELLFTESNMSLLSQTLLNEDQLDWWNDFTDSLLQPCTQGAETQIFKCQFSDWDEALAVDFTRTADSVARRGVDINQILEKDKLTTDLRTLLAPRETPLTNEEALQMMTEWNDELIEPPEEFVVEPSSALQQFIMVDGKWMPVESQWFGQFFNQDSYILIARYWDYDDENKELSGSDNQGDDADDDSNLTKTVVYFWQGREASDLNWLQFEFSVRKDMQARLSQNPEDVSRPLKVIFKRVKQQQEDTMFLAHFQRQFIIHSGHYRDRVDSSRSELIQMYYLRANGNLISTRCIEIKPSAMNLNSCFTYIIKVPAHIVSIFEKKKTDKCLVYIWIGSKASSEDKELAVRLSNKIFNSIPVDFHIVPEGSEPPLFWQVLGGQKNYDRSAEFLTYGRLFRLSNDQGYFCASEKCADFCQDDLAPDDVMLLDTGSQIYLWWSKRTSDVEQKLSLQAAKLYQSHMRQMQPDRPRQLKLTVKNAEPHLFRRCFHGWGPFREPKDWSG
ncbi:Protein flightless-1 isoform 2 [Schistosoma japonicum]|uniref:Protein flightless-1 isoform 2 n=1 Tax=Schistosoma japonicum TaxID=6182 RepID=A0A4Z2DTI5_SCHJA|nr:Protein flightless-1 isoform 2 [Schistosoma japonicum]